METKQSLREQYKKIRAALSKEARAANDSTIARHIIELSLYKDAKTLMAYCAIGSEASIQAVITHALACGKTVLLPVTDPVTQTMYAAQLTAAGHLARGGYGIYEPKDARPYCGPIDLVLVPGLVFGKSGQRIGYGKGYYDKFFGSYNGAIKAGVAYTCQISEESFGEAHDVRMDYIITEQGAIVCE